MAVYERAYRGYAGELTPAWSRFLILRRYAFRSAFRSRLLSIFFALCFLPPIVFAIMIYLHHNLTALSMIRVPEAALIPIVAEFFLNLMRVQAFLAFLLALFVGPALVAPDVANNALALYLCRPFSRTEYVLGKGSVLVILLSLVTWVPGILLFLLQSYLQGAAWMMENLRVSAGIFVSSWLWILVLCLMTLAAAAWVKRKFLSGALVLATVFVSKALAASINVTLRTKWGGLIDIGGLVQVVRERLFGTDPPPEMPLAIALAVLLLLCGLCLALLYRKVRAYEVVRS